MSNLKTIVVGVDFSRGSRDALRLAARIARAHESRLLIAHVADVFPMAPYITDGRGIVPADPRLAGVRPRLERLAEPLRRSGIAVRTRVAEGTPYHELIMIAAGAGAGLVVVGTRGLGAVRRLLLGSTAERLIRNAPMPVLVARGARKAGMIRSIHVGVDFSPGSERALDFALGLAAPFRARVTAVHAVDYGALARQMSRAPAERLRARRAAEAKLRQFVEARPACQGALAPTIRVVEQPAPEALARAAERARADLLVVGTVGRSGIDALLLGNTAERVLRRARLPILAVKPAALGEKSARLAARRVVDSVTSHR